MARKSLDADEFFVDELSELAGLAEPRGKLTHEDVERPLVKGTIDDYTTIHGTTWDGKRYIESYWKAAPSRVVKLVQEVEVVLAGVPTICWLTTGGLFHIPLIAHPTYYDYEQEKTVPHGIQKGDTVRLEVKNRKGDSTSDGRLSLFQWIPTKVEEENDE